MNNTINCQTEGCKSTFTGEGVTPETKYTCSMCTGSSKDKGKVSARIQTHQYDKGLKRSRKPLDTGHIKNQGSDILEADDIRETVADYSWAVDDE